MQAKGKPCTVADIQRISDLINHILSKVLGISHEDKSNRVDMLRKVENQLWHLAEKRDHIAKMFPKQARRAVDDQEKSKDLYKLENDTDENRKLARRNRIKAASDALQMERELKNEEKKKKQQELVLFRGRPSMAKAPKRGPKKEKKTDDKPSQEIID
jgi:hypothetical protein